MAGRVSISKARELLKLAEAEKTRFRMNLLAAAALAEVISPPPVIVGGTAEEYWGGHEYHETDLDMVGTITPLNRAALEELGFERQGRYWIRPDTALLVEFPDTRIDGDESRIATVRVANGSARVIGLDDLYVDRLKQATATEPREDIHFHSALAVAASRYEDIDWQYVLKRINTTLTQEPIVGQAMKRINSRIRSRARRALAKAPEQLEET